eukprot:CAMPEP_0196804632 /NCGR_PEP_ID=MMETSP1362-20130617/4288_1 /TAXON_ID=163516 /ORGANISM="Leptocylindrus danicus, Strain CCMP1856" /LENGTH=77 /DNA_ID=CAMNT_0042177069 /DNA_START=170 /DNA_END=403 /DNA_ORIENTATION=+
MSSSHQIFLSPEKLGSKVIPAEVNSHAAFVVSAEVNDAEAASKKLKEMEMTFGIASGGDLFVRDSSGRSARYSIPKQ